MEKVVDTFAKNCNLVKLLVEQEHTVEEVYNIIEESIKIFKLHVKPENICALIISPVEHCLDNANYKKYLNFLDYLQYKPLNNLLHFVFIIHHTERIFNSKKLTVNKLRGYKSPIATKLNEIFHDFKQEIAMRIDGFGYNDYFPCNSELINECYQVMDKLFFFQPLYFDGGLLLKKFISIHTDCFTKKIYAYFKYYIEHMKLKAIK